MTERNQQLSRHGKRIGRPLKDYSVYIGRRYGRLVVVGVSHKNKYSIYFADTVCDCGTKKKIRFSDLDSGRTVSCGCKHKEGGRRTHSGKGTRLYNTWCSMKARCNNEDNQDYRLYGARGISVCDEWLNDFASFREWSLNNGYKEDLSIDRINGEKGYSPDNCRWTDAGIQARNTSRNVYVEINGEKRTLSEWARIYGIPEKRINDRINKLGWDPVEAVTDTKKHKSKRVVKPTK